ncbi:M23 family metallopeptidase [Pedobacter jeongneungensis]|uniref:M23 family metallopeptidase n=1 Tax=Pedobacter jeongneungensis TaxID=947309 RepID=UPI00046A8A89|nr:M23 family metallopeptidase [Pedobacter jeongneungensis]
MLDLKKNIAIVLVTTISVFSLTIIFIKNTNYNFTKSKYTILKEDSLILANLTLRSDLALSQNQLKANSNNFESEEEKQAVLTTVHDLERKILTRAKTFSELKVVVDNIQLTSPNFVNFPTIIPLKPGTYKRLSSQFGLREHPILKVTKFHQGLDISAPFGTVVYAPANGVVREVNDNAKGYGTKILIEHQFGFKTIFGHLSSCLVKAGDVVNVGQPIARVGSTGLSTGPHLHYEILKNDYKVNPIEFTRITERKLSTGL